MTLPAVTYDRLKNVLTDEGLNFDVDSNDGELIIGFPNAVFFMNINEFTWRTTALWRGTTTDLSLRDVFQQFALQTNSSRSFPKVYVGGEGSEDNPIKVAGETNCVIKLGLTDEQLVANFHNAMGSLFAFFSELESEFPQLVTWTEEG